MCYNTVFTSVPILLYGILEQDYQADQLLKYPQLYKLHKRNYLLSKTQFLLWMFNGEKQTRLRKYTSRSIIVRLIAGIWHATVAYFVPWGCWYINPTILYDNTDGGQWLYGTLIHYIVIMVPNVKVRHRLFNFQNCLS